MSHWRPPYLKFRLSHGEKIPGKITVPVPIMRVRRTLRQKFLDQERKNDSAFRFFIRSLGIFEREHEKIS